MSNKGTFQKIQEQGVDGNSHVTTSITVLSLNSENSLLPIRNMNTVLNLIVPFLIELLWGK